jgi:hypothetical protein
MNNYFELEQKERTTKIGIKQRILSTIAAHPRLFTIGIGAAIAAAVGMGIADMSSGGHLAFAGGGCSACYM